MNPYISDILSQPSTLRQAIDGFPTAGLAPLRAGLQAGTFDRLLITGMGASHHAAYPAVLQLTGLGAPVMLVNAAELLHYQAGLITPRTLLWMNSQSGRSAELVNLLGRLDAAQAAGQRPAAIIACVNDTASPMAAAADLVLPLRAGEEHTVSTKTYTNMLATNLLAAAALAYGDASETAAALHGAAEGMAGFLADWEGQVRRLGELLGEPKTMVILGRGASLAAVWTGSLISKEAAKGTFEGLNSADFRHGPLELVEPGFVALVLAGGPATAALNRGLALEIVEHGGRVVWVDSQVDPELPTLLIPAVAEVARPVAEILPLQMLTLLVAERKGLQAGKFRYVGKITTKE